MKEGHVLGGSEDMTICHWSVLLVRIILIMFLMFSFRDMNMYSKGKSSIEPIATYSGHSSIVGVRF